MSDRNFDVLHGKTGLIKHWTRGVLFEEEAQRQVLAIADMPFIYPHVAIMPDVHAGIGATVGSVIPTRGAVIPAAVGVDIGCGMMAVRLPIQASDLPDNLSEIRSKIEAAVPHGRTDNGGGRDKGAWGEPPARHAAAWDCLVPGFEDLVERHGKAKPRTSPASHIGTLGTGNHFIEVCLDAGICAACGTDDGIIGHDNSPAHNYCKTCEGDPGVWIVLHSGSRGVGNRFGTYFIELAKKDMESWFINLPNKDLAYFPVGTKHFDDYLEAIDWAQNYARVNREVMMQQVLDVFADMMPEKIRPTPQRGEDLATCYPTVVNCHHNYLARENHGGQNVLITRKGAVRARKDDLGIIPGSMGTRSYIVRGKGNPDSLQSCSHGAGRAMSRTEARKRFTVEDHVKATAGVECRKDVEVVDETPAAYKDIDAVMEAQKDLVEVVHTLKQVLCIKG